jgi:hypothetical protein
MERLVKMEARAASSTENGRLATKTVFYRGEVEILEMDEVKGVGCMSAE